MSSMHSFIPCVVAAGLVVGLSSIVAGQSLPMVSIGDVSRLEGNSGASSLNFTVTLSAPVAASVTVMYATQDGTATEGSDYTAASGLLTFSPGQSSLTLSVSVLGDVAVESNEAFGVVLSSPVDATLGRAIGLGTILTDDPAAALAVAAGVDFSCARAFDGSVKCWGADYFGQLGDAVSRDKPNPFGVAGVSLTLGVSAGSTNACAVASDGGAKCWGRNSGGEVGIGFETQTPRLAAPVVGLGGAVSAIAAGESGACALLSGGAVKCWGENFKGQLGDGTTTRRASPGEVTGLSGGVSAISWGLGEHVCALMGNGGVKCWGTTWASTSAYNTAPVDIAGWTQGVLSISAGRFHGCALMSGGGVKCLGGNGWGQLGDGTTSRSLSPVDVLGLSGVTAISAAAGHTCALTSSGGVKCWGYNGSGALGDGTTSDRSSPVDVIGLTSGVQSIAAGNGHTCAVLVSGAVKCWGANNSGQLGNGTFVSSLTPVDVHGLSWTPRRPQAVVHEFFAVDASETPFSGDFNGDGRTDIITFARQNPNAYGDVFVSLSTGTRFGVTDVSTKWHDFFAINNSETVVIGDYDGDGKDDIATWLGRSTRQVYVARSLGTGMTPSQLWVSSIGSAPTDFLASGDANGDGKADLIMFARTEGKVYVALSDGVKFGTPTVWHPFFAVSTYERPRVADVDGDGRSDIVTFATDSPTARGDVYVAMSNGTAFRAANGSPNSDKWHDFFAVQPTEEIRIGDLNGDGKDDFFTFLPPPFGQAYTVLSQGTSMAPNVLWREPIAPALGVGDTVFVGDVNGDGRADIILFAQSEGKVYVSLAP